MENEGKTKNQIKNEEKRKAKLEKFAAKQAKSALIEKEFSKKATSKKDSANSYSGSSSEVVIVPPGEMKDLSEPMATAYAPKAVESSWYSWWELNGMFDPEANASIRKVDAANFTIPIPPPNVTGSLHLGHAMMTSIQDSIIRYKRMKGFKTLYVPGCDHAGISTQVVLEKSLKRERNLTRHDIGRETFLKEAWLWKAKYGDRIYEQFKRMGISTDWKRVKFTMDPSMNVAVNEAFTKLYEDGLIFRANRLVNWSAKIKTTISDLEVDRMEIKERTFLAAGALGKKYEFGVLTSVAYKVHGKEDEEIIVSTTRPETILGDVAVAVNPKDPRYQKYIGGYLINPLNSRLIVVVGDDHADMEFGTGAVKITPAHDMNDFEVGRRHNLPAINILTEDNYINEEGGEKFKGLYRFDAREEVVKYLKEIGAFRGEESHSMVLPICNRSGDIVEPRLVPQWWLNCSSMAAKAVEAVRSKELKIIPKERETQWFGWLNDIRDWCLSRQLWWGHRVPAYAVRINGAAPEGKTLNVDEHWIVALDEKSAIEKAKLEFPDVDPCTISLRQDEDVLDTWFSSALWPYAILGWPEKTKDFQDFYPTTLLETGSDILFFWVARMVMTGLHLTGQLPFSEILLHSIVRDAHGRKMSKSLGNVIDPIDVIEGITLENLHKTLEGGNLDQKEIEKAKQGQKKDFPRGIPECGTDALRFALCAYSSQGSDINLDILRVEGYRKFCNKIWNASRFTLGKLGNDFTPSESLPQPALLVDKWILYRLGKAVQATTESMDNYSFMKATGAVYRFWRDEFCDVYLEAIKPVFDKIENEEIVSTTRNVLYTCMEAGLQMLHPFMPFITEELYQRLPRRNADKEKKLHSISLTMYPCYDHGSNEEDKDVASFEMVNSVAAGIRSIGETTKKFKVNLFCPNEQFKSLLQEEKLVLCSLVKGLSELEISSSDKGQSNCDGESASKSLKLIDSGIEIELIPQ